MGITMGAFIKSSAGVLLSLLALQFYQQKRLDAAVESRQDEWLSMENLWSDEQIESIKEAMRETGIFLPADGTDNEAIFDHIGERREIDENGSCGDGYLVPNKNRTYCTLAARLDVGRHHVTSGGPASHKRFKENILSTVGISFFQRYFSHDLDMSTIGAMTDQVFKNPNYVKISKQFCPSPGITHYEMVTITVLLPGLEIPIHYDVPYFKHVSRMTTPVWLLIALKQSGLWSFDDVPHMQGVAYIHGNKTHPSIDGGDFVLYPNGPYGPKVSFPAKHNTAIFIDGTMTAHGVEPFKPDRKPIASNKDLPKKLVYAGKKSWNMFEGEILRAQYHEDELRFGVVWRELCLPDKHAYDKWLQERNNLNVEDVKKALVDQLESEGIIIPDDPIALANLILDRFVTYPLGDAFMPYNYCLIPDAIEQLPLPNDAIKSSLANLVKHVLKLVCT